MQARLSLPRKLYRYSKERFPAGAALLYVGSLFYAAYCVAGHLGEPGSVDPARSLLGVAILFSGLLRLRISDERKDLERDRTVYPDRMLSRGLVTLRELWLVFWVALALEVAAVLWLGVAPTLAWLAMLAWFALMYVEFFAPVFLNARIGWYLVTHQLLMPFAALFAMACGCDLRSLRGHRLLEAGLVLAAVMCGTVTYEIARKTWSPDREHPLAASYSSAWGIRWSVAAGQLVAFTGAAVFVGLGAAHGVGRGHAVVVALLYGLFAVAGARFWRAATRKNAQLLEVAGAVFTVGLFATTAICFAAAARAAS